MYTVKTNKQATPSNPSEGIAHIHKLSNGDRNVYTLFELYIAGLICRLARRGRRFSRRALDSRSSVLSDRGLDLTVFNAAWLLFFWHAGIHARQAG